MGREGPWHSEAFPSPLNKDSFWSVIAKQLAIHRQGGTTLMPPGLAPGHEERAWCLVHGAWGWRLTIQRGRGRLGIAGPSM